MPVYISTRNRENRCTASTAIIRGLAVDGGLYTPESIDVRIDPNTVIGLSYQQTALRILSALLDDFTTEELLSCVQGAYDDKFDTASIVPLKKTEQEWLMELWHGPTCAFKDIALTILPRLMTTAYRKQNCDAIISILTATSGDTGKAALAGFADVDNTAITVFYPEIGVSEIQKLQMQTSTGNNVKVCAVKGNFDDCQRMVKEAVSSKEVLDACDNVMISSANSINIGRLVPQITYYYYAYANLVEQGVIRSGEAVNFSVPTGNFGDILAGYYAKELGLPIKTLICASNTNHVLTDFIQTGTYSLDRDFQPTISPSMDILISSNLERLLFLLSDNDDHFVQTCMDDLNKKGSYTIPADMLAKLQQSFTGYWVSEDECRQMIKETFDTDNTVIDPHTAIGLKAYRKYKEDTDDQTVCVVLSTASPYKFSHDVYQSITGEDPEDDFEAMEKLQSLSSIPIPQSLAQLRQLPVRFQESIEKEDGIHYIAQRMKELRNV